MIAFAGDVKLTDFGIAKARGLLADNEGEVVAGKADYMSPEQADFQITDKRSDIFSTGVVLGNLLLGYNIFKGNNADESRDRIMSLPLPNFSQINPKIDARLNEILHRTLARDLTQGATQERRTSCSTIWSTLHLSSAGLRADQRYAGGKFMLSELFGQNRVRRPPTVRPDQGRTVIWPSRARAH